VVKFGLSLAHLPGSENTLVVVVFDVFFSILASMGRARFEQGCRSWWDC
jgi:hypothetical protein